MNEATGTVIRRRGDVLDIEVDTAGCARCQAGRGCGAGLLSGGKRTFSTLARQSSARLLEAGDTVTVALQPGDIVRASAHLYGLPLAGLLAGSLLGSGVGFSEAGSVAAGAFGLALGLLVARWRVKRSACLSQLQPEICADIAPEPPDSTR